MARWKRAAPSSRSPRLPASSRRSVAPRGSAWAWHSFLRTGDRDAARAELEIASERAGEASVWLELLEADALAQAGDTAAVRRAVATLDHGILGLRAWRARVEAARQAGDVSQSRSLANQARRWAQTDGTRAEFLVEAGQAAIDMGDVARGRDTLRSAIDLGAAGASDGIESISLLNNG